MKASPLSRINRRKRKIAENGAGKSGKPPKSDKPKSQKLTLSDIFALVKLVWDSLGKPLKRLLKATRVTGFRLDISVGGDDAADAAIKFGKPTWRRERRLRSWTAVLR